MSIWEQIVDQKVIFISYKSDDYLELTLENGQFLILEACTDFGDNCAHGFFVGDNSHQVLIGKTLIKVEKDKTFKDPKLDDLFDSKKNAKMPNAAGEYIKIRLFASDGTTYEFLMCVLHSGYYGVRLEVSLRNEPLSLPTSNEVYKFHLKYRKFDMRSSDHLDHQFTFVEK
jgi:hypothetical protein